LLDIIPSKQSLSRDNYPAQALQIRIKLTTNPRKLSQLLVWQTINIHFRKYCQEWLDTSKSLPQTITRSKRRETIQLTNLFLDNKGNVAPQMLKAFDIDRDRSLLSLATSRRALNDETTISAPNSMPNSIDN